MKGKSIKNLKRKKKKRKGEKESKGRHSRKRNSICKDRKASENYRVFGER